MPLAVRKDLGAPAWTNMANLQTCPQVTTSNIRTKKAMEIKETLANLHKMKSDMKEKLEAASTATTKDLIEQAKKVLVACCYRDILRNPSKTTENLTFFM